MATPGTTRGGQRRDGEQPCGEGLRAMADENSTQAGGGCSQPKKTAVPWAALKAVWPAG